LTLEMKAVFVLSLVLVLVLATPLDFSIIEKVNGDSKSTWEAGVNANFEGASVEYVKALLGWKPAGIRHHLTSFSSPVDVPAAFNSTTNWPACTSIGAIQNQGECGSCWAFGCVEAVTDRFCIASNGSVNIAQLSEQQMTSCGPGAGCQGGDAGAAWDYVKRHGLVSAANYPYSQATCAPADQPCEPDTFKPTLECKTPSESIKHYKMRTVYGVRGEDMQQEMMTNGPFEVCFTVYADFIHYKSGVYQHTSGDALGGHCVKAVGWGTENGQDYWLINNSWTTTWGMNGQFKILRGVDECGIESDVVGGLPAL